MQDDMFLAVLTSDNTFYVFDLLLERKFQYQRDKYSEVANKTGERHDIGEDK